MKASKWTRPKKGSVVKGKVIAIEAGQAIIDVGYKMEGRVDLKEFANPGEAPEIAVGDEVEVFLRSGSKTPAAKRSSAAKWRAVKKHGIVWKKHMPTKSVSMARSLAASKAVSQWTSAAPLRSFLAHRLTCAPYATLAH